MVIFVISLFIGLLTFARDLLASFLESIVGLFRKLLHKDSKPNTGSGQQTIHKHTHKRSKVVRDSDGEYVDFEEIKK